MRTRNPVTCSDATTTYPTLPDLARRGFLGAALAGGSLAAATLLLGPSGGRATSTKPRQRQVRLPWSRSYTFRHGNQRVERMQAQSADPALLAFVRTATEAAGLEKALLAVLDAHTCADLGDGKRLAALQVKLGEAVARRYRERTRRSVAAPTVTLFIGMPLPSCLGQCPAPVPFCRPPAARP